MRRKADSSWSVRLLAAKSGRMLVMKSELFVTKSGLKLVTKSELFVTKSEPVGLRNFVKVMI